MATNGSSSATTGQDIPVKLTTAQTAEEEVRPNVLAHLPIRITLHSASAPCPLLHIMSSSRPDCALPFFYPALLPRNNPPLQPTLLSFSFLPFPSPSAPPSLFPSPKKTHTTTNPSLLAQENIATVQSYMSLSYSPTLNTGRECVRHLCTEDSQFVARTTFPDCKTPLDYADSHAGVMASLSGLHIKSMDILFAKNQFVYLRYSATGSHVGKPHNGIEATGKRAHWTASATFELREGRIRCWWKEWDKYVSLFSVSSGSLNRWIKASFQSKWACGRLSKMYLLQWRTEDGAQKLARAHPL